MVKKIAKKYFQVVKANIQNVFFSAANIATSQKPKIPYPLPKENTAEPLEQQEEFTIPTPKYRNQVESNSSDKETSEDTFEKITKERQPEKIPYDIEKEHRLRANRAEINKVRKENVDVFLRDWPKKNRLSSNFFKFLKQLVLETQQELKQREALEKLAREKDEKKNSKTPPPPKHVFEVDESDAMLNFIYIGIELDNDTTNVSSRVLFRYKIYTVKTSVVVIMFWDDFQWCRSFLRVIKIS